MINLLPDDKKAEIRAGRSNVTLLNYVILSLAGLGLLLLTVVFAYISLTVTRNEAQNRVDDNGRDIAEYQKIQKSADSFRSDLGVAKQILNKDISYSNLLLSVAKVIPDGVVLDSLKLDQTTLGAPTVINAHASSRTTALAFKSKLESNTDLFDDVKFTSIDFEEDPADPKHPVAITMSVVIKKVTVQ